MSLEEAMALLGVTEDSDAKAIKRAYHKLLKRHKPDTDPGGFQRLRAAFTRMNDSLCEREVFVSPHRLEPVEQPTAPAPAPAPEVDPEVVREALVSGDVETALALVMDDRWAHAMLDDEDGELAWITQHVSKVTVLANRTGYDALTKRYPELSHGGMDEELALLIAGDYLMDIAFQVGRLGRLDPEA